MNNPIVIIAFCIVAVILLALIIVLIAKFKSNVKNEKDVVVASRETLVANAAKVSELIVYANDNEELKQSLELLQDKLKYLTPSSESKVKSIDDKIKNTLGGLKIELAKNHVDEKNLIKEVELLIAEREVYTRK